MQLAAYPKYPVKKVASVAPLWSSKGMQRIQEIGRGTAERHSPSGHFSRNFIAKTSCPCPCLCPLVAERFCSKGQVDSSFVFSVRKEPKFLLGK